MDQLLHDFMKSATTAGKTPDAIKSALAKAHWTEDEIKDALNAYTDGGIGIPVPVRKPYVSAREAFMYLVMFVTLYICAFSFGTILFQFVNKLLPDPAFGGIYNDTGISDAIRSALSALIVSFPLFIWMSSLLVKAISKDPIKRGSKIRKWLINLTLFVAATIIIGDLITLVYNVLGGELTLRFFLKSFIVGAITGSIFGYYFWDTKKDDQQ